MVRHINKILKAHQMPAIICKIHGRHIAPHGCNHVSQKIWNYENPGKVTFVDLDNFFVMGWICNECLEKLNNIGLQEYLLKLPNYKDYPPDEEITKFIDLLDLQPMCPKCFEELYKTDTVK